MQKSMARDFYDSDRYLQDEPTFEEWKKKPERLKKKKILK